MSASVDVAAPAIVVALRTATDEDLPFLRDVYASTRAEELAGFGWDAATTQAFVDQQFSSQIRDYQRMHPAARFFVVLADDVPAGRVFLADLPGELRVLDVALLHAYRGRGIGTVIMRHVLAEASARGLVTSLHVEPWSPARRLYERLGFVAGEEAGGFHLRMEAPVS